MKRFICILICAFALMGSLIGTGCSKKPEDGAAKPAGAKLAFTAKDIEGNEITFDSVKGSKLTMINFWEEWCGPCMTELRALEQLYEKYRDKGFVILGVFSDSDEQKVKDVAAQRGLTYPVFEIVPELKQFQTQYVPTTVFFDAEGREIPSAKKVGAMNYHDWELLIDSLIGE